MRRVGLAVMVSMAVAACDSGPSGPGELTGTLRTPGTVLGGALLEVQGKGITGFSGFGGTEVFTGPTGTEDTYRVILMSRVPGELRFQVSVENKGAKKPGVSVVKVVSGGNITLPATADYRVTFSR